MTILETAFPFQHSIYGLREFLQDFSRRLDNRTISTAQQEDSTEAPMNMAAPAKQQEVRPRWTRETENPFDVAVDTYREAIR